MTTMTEARTSSTQWEYQTITIASTLVAMENFGLQLSALGSLGWEMCGFASADPTVGFNMFAAVLKRQTPSFPDPEDGAGWHPDPSKRFERRYHDGLRWTEHVTVGGQQDKDYPNVRP